MIRTLVPQIKKAQCSIKAHICLLTLLIRQLMINGTKLVFLCLFTLPTAEILSGKNARAWVSMVLYLKKKQMKIKV